MARTKALKNRSNREGSSSNDHPKNPNLEMILQPEASSQKAPGVVAKLMGLDQIPCREEEQVLPTRIIVLKPGLRKSFDLKAAMAEPDIDGGASREMAKEIVQMMKKTLGGDEALIVIKAARRKEGYKESSVIREAKKRLFERCSVAAARRGGDRQSSSTLAEVLCSSEVGSRREKVSVRDKVSKLLFWKSRIATSLVKTPLKLSSSPPIISFYEKTALPSPERSAEEQDQPSPVSVLEAPLDDSPRFSETSHLISRSPPISTVFRSDYIDLEEERLPVKSLLISSSWYSFDPWKKMLEEEEREMKRELEGELMKELVEEAVADVTAAWRWCS